MYFMFLESGHIVVTVNVHAFCTFGLMYSCYWCLYVCMYVCVCARARAHVHVCVCACVCARFLENIRPFTLIMDSDVHDCFINSSY
jgi:hypothetical protein